MAGEIVKSGKRAGLERAAAVIICCVVGLVALLAARSLLRAASVLYSFSERRPPITLQLYQRFFHYADRSTDVTVQGSGGEPLNLRLYEPIGRRNPPTIVLLHGTAQEGNRSVSLNRFAMALVHQGFRVVLPTLSAETQYDITAGDLRVIADTVQWASQTAGGDTVSLFGISFGAGLAIPAAMMPPAEGHVRLILHISGYNDLRTIARYYTHEQVVDPTGHPYPQGGPLWGAILFMKPYLDELVPPADVEPIRKAIERTVIASRFPIREGDPVMDGLTPEQQARYIRLQLVNDPETRELYRKLIARHDGDFLRVSPASVLHTLNVPLYVLHATADRDLPEGEVEAMRAELPPGADAHFLVTPWMRHVDIRYAVPWRERIRVGSFVASVLSRAAEK